MSSRDAIAQYAVDVLHRSNYDVAAALKELVPGGPVLVRDQLEEWSPAEAALFEEGLDKYGKDFENIRADLLTWKSVRSLVEFYYVWKSTDRYQNRRKQKASENENKMKQVYIPAHTKPNPAMITQKGVGVGADGKPLFCESCATTDSPQWFAWSQQQPPPNQQPAHSLVQQQQPQQQQAQHKLCSGCWTYWKKYGGLKQESRLDGAGGRPDPGNRAERAQQMQQSMVKKLVACQMPDCQKTFRNRQHMLRHLYNTHEVYFTDGGTSYPLIKTPSAFVMTATLATMLMRRLLAHASTVQLARVQRCPTQPIDFANVHKEYTDIDSSVKAKEAKRLKLRRRKPHFLATGLRRLNFDLTVPSPEWLQRPTNLKPVGKLAFPKPDRIPWPEDQQPLNDRKTQQPSIMRKRTMEASPPLTAKQPPSQQVAATNMTTTTTATPAPPSAAATNLTMKHEALLKQENMAANLTTAHQNGVGPTPAKQQHLSSPSTHGSSSRSSGSRPPVHYPPQSASNNGAGGGLSSAARRGGVSNGAVKGEAVDGGGAATDDFTPDDMFFIARGSVLTARKVLSAAALRKASRRPFSVIRPPLTSTTTTATTVATSDNNGNKNGADGEVQQTDQNSAASSVKAEPNSHSNSSTQSNGNNGPASVDLKLSAAAAAAAAGAAADNRTPMAVD